MERLSWVISGPDGHKGPEKGQREPGGGELREAWPDLAGSGRDGEDGAVSEECWWPSEAGKA